MILWWFYFALGPYIIIHAFITSALEWWYWIRGVAVTKPRLLLCHKKPTKITSVYKITSALGLWNHIGLTFTRQMPSVSQWQCFFRNSLQRSRVSTPRRRLVHYGRNTICTKNQNTIKQWCLATSLRMMSLSQSDITRGKALQKRCTQITTCIVSNSQRLQNRSNIILKRLNKTWKCIATLHDAMSHLSK